jgi:hypothetical protein
MQRFFLSLALFSFCGSSFLLFKEQTKNNWLDGPKTNPAASVFSMNAHLITTLRLPVDVLEEEFWANEDQWDFSQGIPILKSANEQFEGVGNTVYNPRKMREELILRLLSYLSKLDKQKVGEILTESGLGTIERIMRNKNLKELSIKRSCV